MGKKKGDWRSASDPLKAFRGILIGLVLGLTLWACVIYYCISLFRK